MASITGRGGTTPVSSGPEARAAPVTATAIPTHAVTLGCSPVSRPRNTGTSAPRDEIGATTPIVPRGQCRVEADQPGRPGSPGSDRPQRAVPGEGRREAGI